MGPTRTERSGVLIASSSESCWHPGYSWPTRSLGLPCGQKRLLFLTCLYLALTREQIVPMQAHGTTPLNPTTVARRRCGRMPKGRSLWDRGNRRSLITSVCLRFPVPTFYGVSVVTLRSHFYEEYPNKALTWPQALSLNTLPETQGCNNKGKTRHPWIT